MRTPIHIRLPDDLLAQVDEAAGALGQTRTKWIELALRRALSPTAETPQQPSTPRRGSPSPSLERFKR